MKRYTLTAIMAIFCLMLFSQSGWEIRIMPQLAIGANNSVQRPNNEEGTLVNLNSYFERKNRVLFSPRAELEYTYKRNHFIGTATFLKDEFEGVAPDDILYNGELFEQGLNLTTRYKFNTYRIGYRYRIVDTETLAFELGATMLIRDAFISMQNIEQRSMFSNVGVAPLISYYFSWMPADKLFLLTTGDGFAVKAGRAIDLFAGVKYQFTNRISANMGYRLLDGGSDGDRLYTMAFYNYISAAIGIRF